MYVPRMLFDHFRRMMKQSRKRHLPKTDIVNPLANIIFQRLANIRLPAFGDKNDSSVDGFPSALHRQKHPHCKKDLGAWSASLNESQGPFLEGRTRKR